MRRRRHSRCGNLQPRTPPLRESLARAIEIRVSPDVIPARITSRWNDVSKANESDELVVRAPQQVGSAWRFVRHVSKSPLCGYFDRSCIVETFESTKPLCAVYLICTLQAHALDVRGRAVVFCDLSKGEPLRPENRCFFGFLLHLGPLRRLRLPPSQ